MTDEELFGPDACAHLDAFADSAPALTDLQAAILAPLFAPVTDTRAAA